MIVPNNIVFEGKRRYYIEDLTERDYFLENTTPYKLEYKDYCLSETSWGEMLRSLAVLLLDLFQHVNIFEFRCPWSKQVMFSNERKTNYKMINENLYINCGHTALHSCWFIQDLLDFFNINKSEVKLLIHRPSSAETTEIKRTLEQHYKAEFVQFLEYGFNKDTEYSQKVVKRIEKYLNPLLCKISKSYDNLFLFDDFTTASSYIYKIREQVNILYAQNEKALKALNICLKYILNYYKN